MRLDVAGRLHRRRTEARAAEPRLWLAAVGLVLALFLLAVVQLVARSSAAPLLTLVVASGLGAFLLLTHGPSETEAKYAAIFDCAGVGIARMGLDGRWLEVNQAYCDILGYSRRELLALRFQDVTHPDDLDCCVGHMHRVLAGEERSYTMEKRYIRKGGSLVWVELVASVVRGADGKAAYFVGSVMDISARKAGDLERAESERAAREARALVDALYEQAPIGLAYFDCELRSVLINETAARMADLTVEQFVGRRIEEILPKTLGRDVADDLRSVIETGAPTTRSLETAAIPRPHARLDLAVTYYPVRVAGAAAIGVGCIVEDVTERRRSERERERFVVDLRESVRTRDDFLSIASHELRTPLTALSLGAELLVRLAEGADMPTREQLCTRAHRIQDQCKRLERLIGTLLDVARIAQGRVELFPEELDVAQIVGGQIERLRESAARTGSSIAFETSGPVNGQFDRTRLEQIVDNLVSNAVKFGNAKPISVTLESSPEAIRLTVRDQGIGIAKEDRARIFERFERAVSQRHYGGLGLGLWVTRQIVEAMGGAVFVRGELGQGSTFIVEWPRAT